MQFLVIRNDRCFFFHRELCLRVARAIQAHSNVHVPAPAMHVSRPHIARPSQPISYSRSVHGLLACLTPRRELFRSVVVRVS